MFLLIDHLVSVTEYRHQEFSAAHLDRMEPITRDMRGFQSVLSEFNGEAKPCTCWSTSRPPWRSPAWSTASETCRPSGSAKVLESAQALLAGETAVVRIVLRRGPWAVPRSPFCASSRTARPDRLVPGRLHHRPEARTRAATSVRPVSAPRRLGGVSA